MKTRNEQLRTQFETTGGLPYVLAGCNTEPLIRATLDEYSAYESLNMGGLSPVGVVRRNVTSAIEFIVAKRKEGDSSYNPDEDDQIQLLNQVAAAY